MNKIYKLKFPALALVLAVFCPSCAWFSGDITDKEVSDLDKEMKAQKYTTVFEKSLIDLGELLKAYYAPKTVIQSKNVGNMTAEKNLPSDIYVMIAASINKIGPQLVFVPYDAQYVINEGLTGGTIKRLYPQIVIAGGITGFDKDMFDKEREMEATGGWAGAQGGVKVNATANYSRVTLDLNMLDYKTQSYFPGVLASNSIMLQQDKLGWGVYAYYMGNGGSFDYSLKRKQGVHAAVRTLLEYSLIELIGKYFEVPYWRCIPGANPDDEMLRKVRDNFMEKQKDQQHLIIKKMLFLHGFNGLERNKPEFTGPEEGELKEAMRRTSTDNLPDLYLALWKTVPLETATRRVMIDRRNNAKVEALKAAEEEKKAVEAQKQKALENEQRKNESEQKQKTLEETQRRNVEQFKAFIAKGDQLYQSRQYREALAEYEAARGLFGGEEYPAKMIASINATLAEQQAAEEKYRAALQAADSLYIEAESTSFNYSKYKKVLQAYENVLKIKPEDKNAAEKIRAVKEKLSKYSNVLQKENGDW